MTSRRDIATAATVTVALTYAGVTAFTEMTGNFDAVALAFLAGAIATRRWPLIGLFTFLAGWTDERAIVASAFVLAAHLVLSDRRGVAVLRDAAVLAVIGGLAAHALTRVFITIRYNLEQPSNFGGNHFSDGLNLLPIGLWTGLEGLWLVVAAGAAALVRQRRLGGLVALLAGLTAVGIGGIAVVDITRSMAYLLPASLVSIAALARFSPESLTVLSRTALFLSLVWPVYYAGGTKTVYWIYPLPLQLVRHLTGFA